MINPVTWLFRYIKESKEELGKVTWPSRSETIKYSAFVVFISIAMAIFFGGLDWILNKGLEQLISLST